ncbi:hypothetical protein ACROYT_G027224 [Oculina patagonica]
METATTSEFGLDATAIVGCGISLFFCTLSIVAFIFFRPRTESFMIKQHLTFAVGLTQIVLLLSIPAYRKKEGCRAMSVVLHYTITSCFSWCLVDSLFLYFNHANSAHPLRKNVYYLLFGWGFPVTVIAMSLAIGFRASEGTKPVLALYSCWPSDHIVWTFVIPSLLIATLNLMILCVVLHQLRQPSYDICARAVLEKRCTRYGLRTNSLMLLGLCLGWIFGILSFRDVRNVRVQLSFGLINGLQGIFLFFFHCVLNIDIKGYYQSGIHRCSHEDGCLTDRERNKRGNTQMQDPQVGSRRKISSKSHAAADNIPLISVGAQSRSQEASSSRSQSTEPKSEPQPLEVTVVSKKEPEPEKKEVENRPQKPDHDAYPSLPGTPEPHIPPEMSTKQTKRKSLPPELTSKRTKEEVEGISKSATLTSLSNYDKMALTDNENRRHTTTEHLKVHHKVEKSHSEPAIPPSDDQSKPPKKPRSGHVHSSSDARKLSVQSSASTGGGSERKPRRTSRTHQGASLNELESLFSNPVYVKPHRPSVSSLYGSGGGGERKLSYEMVQRPGSRTSSRNTEETML